MNTVSQRDTASALLFVLLLVSTVFAGCSEPVQQTPAVATVSITYPQAEQYITARRIHVRGTASNTGEVVVNGVRATVTGGAWDVLVEFPEGPATAQALAGEAVSKVSFFVDSAPPKIVIESPQRGLVRGDEQSRELIVRGQVTDVGSGLLLLKIDEQLVELDADGRFEHSYTLEVGLNELTITAIDKAGHQARTRRGVIYGPLIDPSERINSAFGITVSAAGFELVTGVIKSLLKPEQILEYVQQTLSSELVSVTAVAFDPIDVQISPKQDHLAIALKITNLRVDGDIRFDNESHATFFGISELEAHLDVRVSATPQGGIKIEVIASELVLDESSIHSDLTDDSAFLRGLVVMVAEKAFSEYIGTLLIEELYDPAILRRKIELLGRSLEFQLFVESVRTTALGMHIMASVEMPSQKYPAVADVAGALNRPVGAGSPASVDGELKVATSRTTIGRIAHGVWRSGLLHQSLEGDDFAGTTLPMSLTADGLATVLDARIRAYADGETPAAMVFRPLLPPVVEFDPAATNSSGIELRIAEFLIDVDLLHPDKARETLLTLALFLDLDVEIAIEGSDVRLSFEVAARAEIADEPLLDFDDERVTSLIEALIEIVPAFFATNLLVTAEAQLAWITLRNPTLDIHGVEGDRVTAGIEAVASGQ
ncbi:MAG: hypothetical protein H0U74_12445 [Bradymonadaceae bacterium]|nr:hypothetical protein [Lujinxingiaceae bacterium]